MENKNLPDNRDRKRPNRSITLSADLDHILEKHRTETGQSVSQTCEIALREYLIDQKRFTFVFNELRNGRNSYYLNRKDRPLFAKRGVGPMQSDAVRFSIEISAFGRFDAGFWTAFVQLVERDVRAGKQGWPFKNTIGERADKIISVLGDSGLKTEEAAEILHKAVDALQLLPVTSYRDISMHKCPRCNAHMDCVTGYDEGDKTKWVWTCVLQHKTDYADPYQLITFE